MDVGRRSEMSQAAPIADERPAPQARRREPLREPTSGTPRRGLGPVVQVASEPQAVALYAEIVRHDRKYPIVGLTCRAGTRDPAMPVELVRERIWPSVPIYVIEPRESRSVNNLLPKDLGVYNGAARVWWPGVDTDSEPSWHPLIYDSTKHYGERALERLAAEFVKVPGSISDPSPREQAAIRLRSVLRPAESCVKPQDSAPVLPLATRKDLRRLTTDLRRTNRDYPIVVLTLGARADEPAFPPSAIRPALDPHVPVYVLGSPDLCRRLEYALDPQLAVHDGDARIFWPGVSRDSDPTEHPLVPAHSATDKRAPADRLIAALDLSRPSVRGHVAVTHKRLQTVEQRAADRLRELHEARCELDMALARAEVAEAQLATLERRLDTLQQAGLDMDELEALARMDPEAIMQRLICREWLTSLQAADRSEHLLGGYRLGANFLVGVEDRRIAIPTARIAFGCAMVACGRAAELPGLEPRHWREGKMSGSGDDAQVVRTDGGKGWMCTLGHGRATAARLCYWVLPCGDIEFDSVRTPAEVGQRG